MTEQTVEASTACPVILVTGTGSKVGKTIATAALAAALTGQGQRVSAIEPAYSVQSAPATGGTVDVDEAGEVSRLTGIDARRFSPASVEEYATAIADLARSGCYDAVLVDGTGGLLARLDASGATLADLATVLQQHDLRTGFVVVADLGPDTLSHAALTLEVLNARKLDLVGIIVGSAPRSDDLVGHTRLEQLRQAADGRFLGCLPQHAGQLPVEDFRASAGDWLLL